MKRPLIALTVVAALGAAGMTGVNVLSATQAGDKAVQAAVQQETRTFAVENMTCAACPITVRKAMQGVEGVKSVDVDFGAKTATVVFDPAVTTPDAIAQASANAGYPARAMTQGG
ncbi:MAG: heavy-metal-associated domain-containing protein [Alphaproteobacteria bacterium]|nr:MAG: heavy-metal-associated domain-containing protein [Alphaproteobacteria bacterium]